MFWFQLTRPQKHCCCLSVTLVLHVHVYYTLKQELNGATAYEETSTDEKTVINGHSNDLPYKFAVNVKERQDRLPMMYW